MQEQLPRARGDAGNKKTKNVSHGGTKAQRGHSFSLREKARMREIKNIRFVLTGSLVLSTLQRAALTFYPCL